MPKSSTKKMGFVPGVTGFSALKALKKKWEVHFLIELSFKNSSLPHLRIYSQALYEDGLAIFLSDLRKVLKTYRFKGLNVSFEKHNSYQQGATNVVFKGVSSILREGTDKKIQSFALDLSNLNDLKQRGLRFWCLQAFNQIRCVKNLSLKFFQLFGLGDKQIQTITYYINRRLKHLKKLSLEFSDCNAKNLKINDSKLGTRLLLKELTELKVNLNRSGLLLPSGLEHLSFGISRNLSKLQSLTIDLSYCALNDEEKVSVAKYLGKSELNYLKKIKVNFSHCNFMNVENLGQVCLAFAQIKNLEDLSLVCYRASLYSKGAPLDKHEDVLSPSLKSLSLNFEKCKLVLHENSQWLMEIIEMLPKSLESLSLNLGSCQEISDSWMIHFGESLLQHSYNLKTFRLNLAWTKVNDGLLARLGGDVLEFLKNLQKLDLHFGWSGAITDKGIEDLSNSISVQSSTLQSLHLAVEGYGAITEQGAQAIQANLTKRKFQSLASLYLSFRGCGELEDGVVEALSKIYLENVRSLCYDLRGCGKLTDQSLSYLSSSKLIGSGKLKELSLLFSRCKLLTENGVEKFTESQPMRNGRIQSLILDFEECYQKETPTPTKKIEFLSRNDVLQAKAKSGKTCSDVVESKKCTIF